MKPLILLVPEHGIPLEHLMGKVAFFATEKDRGGYRGFFRSSPRLFARQEDGAFILGQLHVIEAAPVARPVDKRQLKRRPGFLLNRKVGGREVAVEVTVPEREEAATPESSAAPKLLELTQTETRHTEIQARLLQLGADMGLDVWVARNDRGKSYQDRPLGSMNRILDSLPTQFNEITTTTVELIDVLWLKGNSIQAAFEIESTTSVYSGLLRMSDLLALQPNLDIDLYLVAPDDRRGKVRQELLRPTFQLRDKPLASVCGFVSFSSLTEQIDGIRKLGLIRSVKPDFLRASAEFFGTDERGRTSAPAAG